MDDNTKDIIEIKEKLARIETLLSEKISYLDTRVSKLEANQKWVVVAIVGAVMAAIIEKVIV